MSRKRKELPTLEGVKITDVAAEGNALARVDDMVVFIPFGAPGDVADVKFARQSGAALRALHRMWRLSLAASAV